MHLECCEVFGKYVLERLLLKCEIVFKSIPSDRTGVDPEWVKELWWKKAIGL